MTRNCVLFVVCFVFCLSLSFEGLAASGRGVSSPDSQREAEKRGKKNGWVDKFTIRGMTRLFARFAGTLQGEGDAARLFSEFDLQEFQLGFRADWDRKVGIVFRMESLRSSGPQSLFGIDGDAYVFRVQQAWGYGRLSFWKLDIEARGGLIREPWIELVQAGYGLRGIGPLLSQAGDFFAPSDLGVQLGIRGWGGLVELRYAMTNGEGLNQTEQNPGKNSMISLSVRPLKMKLFSRPALLSIHAAFRDGSIGAGSAQNHRIAGALTFQMPGYNLGAEYVVALGWRGMGEVTADAFSVWFHADVYRHWIGLLGRFDRLNTNMDLDEAVRMRLFVGVYSDLLRATLAGGQQVFRLIALYQYDGRGVNSGPFPGLGDQLVAHRLMVFLTFNGRGEWKPGRS